MKSPNPFSGGVDALSDADFALLVDAVETRRCRELVGAGTYDEAARKWRPVSANLKMTTFANVSRRMR